MTESTLHLARRHIAMGSDQVWMLSRHHLARMLRRPLAGGIEPLDGSVRFAIVVVNFSTTRFLKLLLLTLTEQTALGLVHRIVIVDNGSVDGGVRFLRQLAGRSPRVGLVERHRLLDHAHGIRAGVSQLRADEHDVDATSRCNVYLFSDPDVIFRDVNALHELAATVVSANAGLVGEWRGTEDDPDIQASFLAVRIDAYARPDVLPPVHHGSPTRWMQRSIARAGDVTVAAFASNQRGFVLHRGRSAVTSSTAPHFMGVPDGAGIWAAFEARLSPLLEADAESELLDVLVERFEDLGTDPAGGQSRPVVEHRSFDLHQPLAWSPGVLQRRSLDAVLVLQPPGEPLRLPGIAALLWAMFEKPSSPADVAAAATDAFSVAPAKAREEVAAFVRPLITHGALRRAESVRPHHAAVV